MTQLQTNCRACSTSPFLNSYSPSSLSHWPPRHGLSVHLALHPIAQNLFTSVLSWFRSTSLPSFTPADLPHQMTTAPYTSVLLARLAQRHYLCLQLLQVRMHAASCSKPPLYDMHAVPCPTSLLAKTAESSHLCLQLLHAWQEPKHPLPHHLHRDQQKALPLS
jgi:hypothetical protein